MGALRSRESFEAEVEEFCREMAVMLQHRKQLGISYNTNNNNNNTNSSSKLLSAASEAAIDRRRKGMGLFPRGDQMKMEGEGGGEQETVCVTSGISFLGFAVANRLLARGYSVRLLLDTQEDLEKVREMGMIFGSAAAAAASDGDEFGGEEDEMNNSLGAWRAAAVVVGDMTDVESLCQAFHGCRCVFHTSSFSDPTGVSGYSKHMAEAEARTAERLIEACVRTESVKKCVFTSSLLACIWRGNSPHNNRLPIIVDENCWSDESLCRDRKLWYALGKTMAEKAAWRAARGRDLKLVTLCPGLVTGPGFRRRNSTASIAYLKGGQEMLRDGLLAAVDVGKLAEAHVGVYEAMSRTACGRYICFDHIIRRVEDVAELERQLGIPNRAASSSSSSSSSVAASGSGGSDQDQPPPTWSELSKRKLARLMSSTRRRCSSYNIYNSMLC